jgi:hypothetical protein
MRRPVTTRLRRALNLTGSLLVAMCALLTAAYAATGHLPLAGGMQPEGTPQVGVERLSGAGFTRAAADGVLFNARNLTPGIIRAAQITITNSGTAAADVTFRPSDLTDAPAGLPERLSSVLVLSAEDATNRFAPITFYSGTLARVRTVALGRFAPGESRVYRFTITFPAGRSDAADNPLQGAVSTIRFHWDTVASVTPTTPPVTTPTTTTTTPTQPAAPVAPSSPPAAPAPASSPARLSLAWRPRRSGGGILARVRCLTACRGSVKGTMTIAGRGPAARRTVTLRGRGVRLGAGRGRGYALVVPRARAARMSAAVRAGRQITGRVTLTVRTSRGTRRITGTLLMRPR